MIDRKSTTAQERPCQTSLAPRLRALAMQALGAAHLRRRGLAFHTRLLVMVIAATLCSSSAEALSKSQMLEVLRTIDARQSNTGDYRARAFILQEEKGKEDLVYEAVIYRRDGSHQFSLLFTKPKAEAGKGYLRRDKILFLYDPTIGRWERRTERESIGGTISRSSDFDESRLAEEFDPHYVAEDTLGKFAVHHLRLRARSGAETPYPVVHLWIDKASGNILKRADYALSGRLMRTSYFPKWRKMYSREKRAHLYFPREIRIFDEVERGKNTTIVFLGIDLGSLPGNIFTKAWIESKSR